MGRLPEFPQAGADIHCSKAIRYVNRVVLADELVRLIKLSHSADNLTQSDLLGGQRGW